MVQLSDSRLISIPTIWFRRLRNASQEQLNKYFREQIWRGNKDKVEELKKRKIVKNSKEWIIISRSHRAFVILAENPCLASQ